MAGTAEKMHTGELYDPMDETLFKEQSERMEQLYEFNRLPPSKQDRRNELMKELFAEIGEGCYIEPPLHANWAGKFLHLGDGVYANFNLTLVDDTHIYIGDHTLIGPNVTIATANHPLNPTLRSTGWQYNLPIHIGKNCWLGAGVIVLPGVTIHDNSVIGAGSVVTHDIPADSLAVGNPCRVIRTIGENERQYYRKGVLIPEEIRNRFGL
ncbi:MAG: sugar O-acetyltransferase [Solobacterium sp.]|nr:sugar O-acetyltransferase [Solobacterium sp.]